MKQWIIYKHTSKKSGKSYIGLTCISMERRWIQHVSESRTKCKYHFQKAIALYGPENWKHTIIADGIDTLEEANALERYYIKKFDTFENGYNSTMGGDGTRTYKDDPTLYEFYHCSYGLLKVTCRELSSTFDLRMDRVVELSKESIPVLKGWVLFKNKEPIRLFVNGDVTFEGTTDEFIAHYNFDRGSVQRVVNKKRKHHKGWKYIKDIEETPCLH